MPPSTGLQAVGLNLISTGGPNAGGRRVGEEALDLCSGPRGTRGRGLQAAGGGSWAWRVGVGVELQFQPGEGRAADGPPPSLPTKA